MPIVKIHAAASKPAAFKAAVYAAVREAIVLAFRLKPADVTQYWLPFEPTDMDDKSYDFLYVEVLALAGRSADAKRRLFRAIVDGIAAPCGLAPTDILVQVFDIPKENCGTRGGLMAADIELGFRTDV